MESASWMFGIYSRGRITVEGKFLTIAQSPKSDFTAFVQLPQKYTIITRTSSSTSENQTICPINKNIVNLHMLQKTSLWKDHDQQYTNKLYYCYYCVAYYCKSNYKIHIYKELLLNIG